MARCEVRLSTFHRIAVGMLSGAGLLVVLPVVARDSITGILGSLVDDGFGAADAALTVAVVAMLAVPAAALWLLFADLTRFYFHANHIRHEGGETFTPRFTLTGLRLPSDELGAASAAALACAACTSATKANMSSCGCGCSDSKRRRTPDTVSPSTNTISRMRNTRSTSTRR